MEGLEKEIVAVAVAARSVGTLLLIGVMWAVPWDVRWGRGGPADRLFWSVLEDGGVLGRYELVLEE